MSSLKYKDKTVFKATFTQEIFRWKVEQNLEKQNFMKFSFTK